MVGIKRFRSILSWPRGLVELVIFKNENNSQWNVLKNNLGHPNKMLLWFPIARPTHFFRKVKKKKKKKKIPDSPVKEVSTLLYKHTILF